MNPNEKPKDVRRTVWPGGKAALRRVGLITLVLFPLSWAVFALLVGDWQLNIGDGTQAEEETVRHLREWLVILAGTVGVVFLLSLLAFFQWAGRFSNWLVSGRRLRWLLITMAWAVTAAALFYAEEDWRGGSAWGAYRHQLEAGGTQLDFKTFIPPPIPDQENFAATPFVKSWFQEVDKTVVTNTSERFLQLWQDNYAAVDRNIGMSKSFKNRRCFTDLVSWGMAFEKLKSGETNLPAEMVSDKFDLASRAAAAPGVLAGLKTNELDLAALGEASRLPSTRYPVVYDLNDPWGILLPHLRNVKFASQRLELRASAELAAGHSDAALADIKLTLHVADTLKEEPFLISYLVRIACVQIAIQPVWEGLSEHAWSDAQLQELQASLQAYDFITDQQHPFNAEWAAGVLTGELIKKKGLGYMIMIVGPGQPSSMSIKVANWWGAFIPRGWYDLEELNYSRLYQLQLAKAFDAPQKRIYPERIKDDAAGVNQAIGGDKSFVSSFLHHKVMARVMLGSFDKILRRTAEGQTVVNQAALACALERCRLANGQFPKTLEALAPAFIPQPPLDVITGEPYKYRRSNDGEFVLYSIGWDEKDDSGVPGKTLLADEGDWVWSSGVK